MSKSKTKVPADRLPVSQRIDSKMDSHPLRRKSRPTDWAIKGELFLNCNCTVFCPCVVSLGQHPPTEGNCKAWMAIAIDEGHFEGEDLSGINIGLLAEIPGRMAEGNWKVAVYIDEKATQKAYNGLLQILSGAAGGTTGLFTVLVSEIIGAEREKVDIMREGTKRGLYIGRKVQGEIEMLTGADPDQPVVMTNTKYWMGSDVIAARGLKSKVRDYGRVWDLSGKSAEICAIDWKGPKP
ncbi:DUF1326 domain-containing protein [Octadecabacter sp. 1_MG-2023]|uniref:DUF1326 domain-containing protein n=1 Tax=unclassified Octadecabacter TaxID=196158 RepID=UPI001C0900A8|nr:MULTISPECIES: DUF1326 domain-containing protein [unclassified Octadecabacter]MBU2993116.1 DUF1326 domain-containing protein [Octadecabacter sp. B2R22]MDO6733432.1 DUF1326 domain-containing protein [Octadecabacter sp. 1_MG-2023]